MRHSGNTVAQNMVFDMDATESFFRAFERSDRVSFFSNCEIGRWKWRITVAGILVLLVGVGVG